MTPLCLKYIVAFNPSRLSSPSRHLSFPKLPKFSLYIALFRNILPNTKDRWCGVMVARDVVVWDFPKTTNPFQSGFDSQHRQDELLGLKD
ncbi:hypothetical protein N431DRAFT_433883 [Stipitochalara longipes BDJ]|nr:hypothetical protein N431DRAFT_433883 [Stipitochalara longipes BDJ]